MAGEISIEFGTDADVVKRWNTHVEVNDDRIVVELKHSSGATITTNTAGGFYWEWPVGETWANGVETSITAALAAIQAAQETSK